MMKRLTLLFVLLASLTETAWGQISEYPGAPTEHGSVTVLLAVNAEGAVDDCHIKRPSGVPSLDTAACPMARRGRFRPVTDGVVSTSQSSQELTFHFILPHMTQSDADLPIGQRNQVIMVYSPHRQAAQNANGAKGLGQGQQARREAVMVEPEYPSKSLKKGNEGTVYVVIDVSATGKPEDCSVARTSGFYDLDKATCIFAIKNLKYAPGKDYYGTNIEDTDLFRINWIIPFAGPVPQ